MTRTENECQLGKSVAWTPDPEEAQDVVPCGANDDESGAAKKRRSTFGCLGIKFANILLQKNKSKSRKKIWTNEMEQALSHFFNDSFAADGVSSSGFNDVEDQLNHHHHPSDKGESHQERADKSKDCPIAGSEAMTIDETRSYGSSSYLSSTSSEQQRIDTKKVKQGKWVMYLVLIVAAATTSGMTYCLACRSQRNEMATKFDMYAGEVVRTTHSSAESILQSIQSLSFSLTSHRDVTGANDSSGSFPYVTHPHFHRLGEYACKLSKAVFVAYAPRVEETQLNNWNLYSKAEQTWLPQSLLPSTTVPPIHESVYYPAVNNEDGELYVDETPPSNSSNSQSLPSSSNDFFPIWQVSPASSLVSSYLNMNLMRHGKGIPKTIHQMIHYAKPVWSSVAPFGNAHDHLEHIRKKSCVGSPTFNCASDVILEKKADPGEFPHTMLFVPVFRDVAATPSSSLTSYQEKSESTQDAVAGTIMAVFPWDSLFANLLSEDVDGVVVVADDHCGKTFTFEIDGADVHYLGLGDWHDEKFDSMRIQTTFLKEGGDDFNDDDDDDGCHYQISVYPSETFIRLYMTDRPMLYAVAIGAIFAITALVFFLYDVLVERRQKRALKRLTNLKAKSAAEKAFLLVQSANSAARAERDLNDYLAHEVRNPLAAALAATNFVSTAVGTDEETETFFKSPEKIQSIREDMAIIDSSLHFVNEVLRSTLDMHRTSSEQLKIEFNPADLLQDVLMPVQSMLYQRSTNFQVLCECPADLVVLTDKMRLKQIVLNLARNSSKFVSSGYIRLKAIVKDDDGTVQVTVEDSGPGIPESKKKNLFVKFQSSHDTLNEGTGVGLSLCKNLTELMGCDLYLDEDFQSGIEGNPGARIVIDLNVPPLKLDRNAVAKFDELKAESTNVKKEESPAAATATVSPTVEGLASTKQDAAPDALETSSESIRELPTKLRVLQVEDDMVLRKLFARSLKRVAPGWELTETSSGETALEIVDAAAEPFDLIFMDQYMSTCGKKLTGTETTRMMRAKGIQSTICGLSANDVSDSFQEAGANSFLFKPFPCQTEALKLELSRIVYGNHGSFAESC